MKWNVLEAICRLGGFHEGHYKLSGGRHSSLILDGKVLLGSPTDLESALLELMRLFPDDIDIVVGPAHGCNPWIHLLAKRKQTYPVSAGLWVALFAERVDGRFVFKHGFGELLRGKRVLLFDDVVSTGRSLREVAELVREYGGIPGKALMLVNRGAVTAEMCGVQEIASLADHCVESYEPGDFCPGCVNGRALDPVP